MGIFKSLRKRCYELYNYITIKSWGGRILLGKNVQFHQLLDLYGEGTIIIKDKCELGVRIGGGFFGSRCELQVRNPHAVISIGEDVRVNNNLFIGAEGSILIGDMCLIGRNVTIMDHNAHGTMPEDRRSSVGTIKDVVIGKNVWIGNNVTILPGVHIGDNCIVAVSSVVKGEFPDNVIIAGNPAYIVKYIQN